MDAGLEFRLDSLHLKSDGSNASRSTDDDIVVVQKDNNLLEMCQCSICFEKYTNAIRASIRMQCGLTYSEWLTRLITGKLFRCVVCQTVSIIGFGTLNKNIILTEILHKFGLLEPDPDAPVYTPPKTTSKLPENIFEGMDTSKRAELFLSPVHPTLRTKSRKLLTFGSCQHFVDKIISIKAAISQWFVNAATSAPSVDRRRPIFSLEARITDNNPVPAPSSSENARFRRINGSNLYRSTRSLFADEVHSMYRQVASEGSRMSRRKRPVWSCSGENDENQPPIPPPPSFTEAPDTPPYMAPRHIPNYDGNNGDGSPPYDFFTGNGSDDHFIANLFLMVRQLTRRYSITELSEILFSAVDILEEREILGSEEQGVRISTPTPLPLTPREPEDHAHHPNLRADETELGRAISAIYEYYQQTSPNTVATLLTPDNRINRSLVIREITERMRTIYLNYFPPPPYIPYF